MVNSEIEAVLSVLSWPEQVLLLSSLRERVSERLVSKSDKDILMAAIHSVREWRLSHTGASNG